MNKPILFGVSIAAVLAIILGAVALGFVGAPADVDNSEDAINASTINASADTSARNTSLDNAIAGAQANVSFTILRPGYIPGGYVPDIPQITGMHFIGTASEAEQAVLAYANGNATILLQEILIIKDNIDPNATIPADTRRIVDINGIEGRFSVEPNGEKYLGWKMNGLRLTIRSYTFNGTDFSGSSLSMEEMIEIAGSVR